MIRDSYSNHKFVICSDSQSALQAISNKQVETSLVQQILLTIAKMNGKKEIIFCWVPSHVNIKGNETADLYAKKSLKENVTEYFVPYTDFKKYINDFIKYSWQTRWNACQGNKLHAILPQVMSEITMNVNTRRDQTVIHRCLIGHCRLTHLHLLNNEPAPICRKGRQPLTIKPILIECQNTLHRRPYQAENLKQLFSKDPTNTIFTQEQVLL